ncbi:hypothetical protein EVAR_27608_1 [Eumeta japonica]|uniref:Uncharacterized protein n=1 Tax=Eumeta variegata TaxID=151549 RepID=A0A4C1V0D6_EUMVA|nr:hypothetical protein EVAR_27608_1 [Eumeta japonica]
MCDPRFTSEEVIDFITETFSEGFDSISVNDWRNAICLWKIHLQKCIDAEGDYFEQICFVLIGTMSSIESGMKCRMKSQDRHENRERDWGRNQKLDRVYNQECDLNRNQEQHWNEN